MTQTIRLRLTIPDAMRGRRLDQALAELVQDYSRSRLQQWIRAGQVSLDERIPQVRERLHGGETVCIDAVIEAADAQWPRGYPAAGGPCGRRFAGHQQAGRAGGAPGGRQSCRDAAECAAAL